MKKTLLERRTRINVDATLRQRGARSQGARTRNDYLNVNKARFSRIILFSQKEKKINLPALILTFGDYLLRIFLI